MENSYGIVNKIVMEGDELIFSRVVGKTEKVLCGIPKTIDFRGRFLKKFKKLFHDIPVRPIGHREQAHQ